MGIKLDRGSLYLEAAHPRCRPKIICSSNRLTSQSFGMTLSQRNPQIAGPLSAGTSPTTLSAGGKLGSLRQQATASANAPVNQRLGAFGLTESADLDAFWTLVKVRYEVDRGQTIIGAGDPVKRFTILLGGVACFASRQEDGGRQVYAFHYQGDFLGLHKFVFPKSAELSEVQALTRCSIGTIDRDELEQAVQHHPALGRTLWRAAITEASTCRQRLVVSRRPALQRVAHILCEQLARLGADERVIPLTQIDVADAAGLSPVHINRVFQELRQLGALSKQRLIEVVSKNRLHEIAGFDANYLDASASLTRWDLRIGE